MKVEPSLAFTRLPRCHPAIRPGYEPSNSGRRWVLTVEGDAKRKSREPASRQWQQQLSPVEPTGSTRDVHDGPTAPTTARPMPLSAVTTAHDRLAPAMPTDRLAPAMPTVPSASSADCTVAEPEVPGKMLSGVLARPEVLRSSVSLSAIEPRPSTMELKIVQLHAGVGSLNDAGDSTAGACSATADAGASAVEELRAPRRLSRCDSMGG